MNESIEEFTCTECGEVFRKGKPSQWLRLSDLEEENATLQSEILSFQDRYNAAIDENARLKEKMDKSNWIWMPHAGHLCVGSKCQFKLNTYVNGYIVSTVGEWLPHDSKDGKFEEIGYDRLYETMVFKAKKSDNKCCPYEQDSGSDIDFEGYKKASEATLGHIAMCEKYAAMSEGNGKV